MAKITFTIPSVLNAGNGEKKTELDAATLKESFEKISEIMGDDFKRRVLESDGYPRSLINIYINGKNAAFSDGIDTPLTEGDEISVMILGNSMEFRITKVGPKKIVRIDRSTNLKILSETVSDKKIRITYEEVGGLVTEIKSMREIVELPLKHPELFSRLGVEPHSGILLHGPPGCGKTLLAKVLASESDANIYSLNGP